MRPRLVVSRALLLTVPRECIDDIEGPAYVRIGYTIRWRIPQVFEVSTDTCYRPQLFARSLPATIQWIHRGEIGLRIALNESVYVRYTA